MQGACYILTGVAGDARPAGAGATAAVVPPTTPRRTKPVTPVNIKLSVASRSASADDGTHMSSLLAAVAAPLSGRSGCASGHMCRRLSVTSSGRRRGTASDSRYGPGRAQPGPARLTPGPAHGCGSYININWLATGPAYGPAPALRS